MSRRPRAILFDLDGTLVDSAPDLLAALGHVRTALGQPAADLSGYRHLVSRGAAGLLAEGLDDGDGVDPDAARAAFLDHYRAHCWVHSRPFPGIEALLEGLDHRGMPWGVVTNKTEALARAVVAAAGWSGRCGCLIGGDTVARAKPDPAPVHAALAALGVPAETTWFIGDDRRDVVAGRAAGVATGVAAWGYIPPGEDPATWGAGRILATPAALETWLDGGTRAAS